MAVLVTGVGYIGAKLIDELLRVGEHVVAIDNYFSTDRRAIGYLRKREGLKFVEGSVNSRATLAAAFSAHSEISTVYSLAAQSSAHPGAASARYTEITNLLSPRLLLDTMLEFGTKTIVYGSSFWVYGRALPEIITEHTPYGSFSDLSHLSKCYVEKLLEMYAKQAGLCSVAVRLGIVYGISPVMKRDYRTMTAPNKFCLQAVRGEEIVVNSGAECPAGFIHIEDACQGLLAAARIGTPGDFVPVNLVTEMLTIHEVARIVAREAGARGILAKLRFLAPERVEKPRVTSRIDDVGFIAKHKMDGSLGSVLDFFARAESLGDVH
jgi:UDP-glucuronate decarboxylase